MCHRVSTHLQLIIIITKQRQIDLVMAFPIDSEQMALFFKKSMFLPSQV
jgi:hypothetical protein